MSGLSPMTIVRFAKRPRQESGTSGTVRCVPVPVSGFQDALDVLRQSRSERRAYYWACRQSADRARRVCLGRAQRQVNELRQRRGTDGLHSVRRVGSRSCAGCCRGRGHLLGPIFLAETSATWRSRGVRRRLRDARLHALGRRQALRGKAGFAVVPQCARM